MQTPKSSDTWKGFDRVLTPAQSLLEEEYKLGRFYEEFKGKHSLGNAKTTVTWNVPKADKGKPAKSFWDGKLDIALETTQQMAGSPLKIGFGKDGLSVHRDMGNMKIGNSGIHFNPWWGWTNKKSHGMTWWDQVWKTGYIFQWHNYMAASEFVWNANDKSNGPGPWVHNHLWRWRFGNNEVGGVGKTTMTPGLPGAQEGHISYSRFEKDWDAYLRLAKVHPHPNHEQEESAEVGATYKGKHEGMDWEAGLLVKSQLKKAADWSVALGGSFKACNEWHLFKKMTHESVKGESATKFWLMLRQNCNDWCWPMSSQVTLMVDTKNLKNVNWGFKCTHNL